MKKLLFQLLFTITFGITASAQESIFKDDRDGKTYSVIRIGNQTWLGENLVYAPANGNYWSYDNDNGYSHFDGYLYDWKTAQNICPKGWHLPNDIEWQTLSNNLGGDKVAGRKMAFRSTESEFRGRFAGTREKIFNGVDSFYRIGEHGLFWSSNEALDYDFANARYITIYEDEFGHSERRKESGLSVRCIKD